MWPNPQVPADLVTFTEKIVNGNFIFCAAWTTLLFLFHFRSHEKNRRFNYLLGTYFVLGIFISKSLLVSIIVLNSYNILHIINTTTLSVIKIAKT